MGFQDGTAPRALRRELAAWRPAAIPRRHPRFCRRRRSVTCSATAVRAGAISAPTANATGDRVRREQRRHEREFRADTVRSWARHQATGTSGAASADVIRLADAGTTRPDRGATPRLGRLRELRKRRPAWSAARRPRASRRRRRPDPSSPRRPRSPSPGSSTSTRREGRARHDLSGATGGAGERRHRRRRELGRLHGEPVLAVRGFSPEAACKDGEAVRKLFAGNPC